MVFQILGFGKKLGFHAFLWFSRRPQAPEIHTFCLKSQFLRKIQKKTQNPNFRENHMGRPLPLFVFSINGLKQNARSLLTPVSDPAFQALSHGCLGFALHGSFLNHFIIGQNYSTANQNLRNKWLSKLPWRIKCRLSCERA